MVTIRYGVALILLLAFSSHPVGAGQSGMDQRIDQELPALVTTYKMLHTNPELSHHEAKTSVYLAAQLRSYGYEVTEGVGKYDRLDWKGYGVVALMKNGSGPTILVR